jgi:prefoldin subunit 5
MKTIKELQAEIEVVKAKGDEVNKAKQNLVKEKQSKIIKILEEYFYLVVDKGFEIDYTRETAYFKFKDDDGYSKDGLSLYFRNKDYRGKNFDQIQTSFYSTNCNSDSELARMVMIGLVGNVLLTEKDEILVEVNRIHESFENSIEPFRKKQNLFAHQITELRSQIREIEQRQAFDQIESEEGMSFEINREYLHKMPNIDIKYDWTIVGITNIKLIGKTKSGKSGTLEITTYRKAYNHEEKKYEDAFNTETYEKVRMKNIECFVRCYKDDQISAS